MWSRLLKNSWQIGWAERLFLAIRWLLTPYAEIAQHIPGEGRILDFGCGHGLLSLYLAEQSPGRTVVGLDHDAKRVTAAQRAGESLPNLRFCSAQEQPDWQHGFQCVVCMDMLHYLTFDEQQALLARACDSLGPDGVLVVREVEQARGLRYALNYVYEWLATHIGFTKSSEAALYLRSRQGWLDLLHSLGLEASARRVSFCLFSDVLFTAHKPRVGSRLHEAPHNKSLAAPHARVIPLPASR